MAEEPKLVDVDDLHQLEYEGVKDLMERTQIALADSEVEDEKKAQAMAVHSMYRAAGIDDDAILEYIRSGTWAEWKPNHRECSCMSTGIDLGLRIAALVAERRAESAEPE